VESENFELNNLPPIEPVDDTRAKKLLTKETIRFGKLFSIGLPWKENVIMTKNYFYGKMETRLSQFDKEQQMLLLNIITWMISSQVLLQRKKESKSVNKLWRFTVMEVSNYVIFARVLIHNRAS